MYQIDFKMKWKLCIAVLLIFITSLVFYIVYKKDSLSNEKYLSEDQSTLFWAPYFGKRIAFWGIFSSNNEGAPPCVLFFADPKIKVRVIVPFLNTDEFFKKIGINLYENQTKIVYLSGLVIFVGIKGPGPDPEYGYGSFYITNPEIIEVLSERNGTNCEKKLSHKITIQRLMPEDKKTNFYIGNSTPQTLKKQLEMSQKNISL